MTVTVNGEKFRYIDTRSVKSFVPHSLGCMYEGSNNTIKQVTQPGGVGQMEIDPVGQNEEIELRHVVSLLTEAIPLLREAIPLLKQALPLLREIGPLVNEGGRSENRTEERTGNATVDNRSFVNYSYRS